MAKVILFSFYDGKGFSFDESIQECRRQYRDFAADDFSHYKLVGIDRAGLNCTRGGGGAGFSVPSVGEL